MKIRWMGRFVPCRAGLLLARRDKGAHLGQILERRGRSAPNVFDATVPVVLMAGPR